MKLILLLSTILSLSLFAKNNNTIIDCTVKTVFHTNVFEEGLSTYEYPSFSIEKYGDKYLADIGVMQEYDSREEDTVVPYGKQHSWKQVFQIYRGKELTKHETELRFFYYLIEDYNEDGDDISTKEGMLMFRDFYETNNEWEPLAKFDCK